MRILNVGQNYFVAGGSDQYMMALQAILLRAGHEVIPFAGRSPRNLETPWSEWFPAVPDFVDPGPGDIAGYVYNNDAARKLDSLLRAHPVDIAHLHIYYGKLTAAILPVFARHGVPVVQTLHDFKLVCPVYTQERNGQPCTACANGKFFNCLRYRCKRDSLARSALSMVESYASLALGAQKYPDRFIAVSEFSRRIVVDMGVPVEKVNVLHNFVADAAFVAPAARSGYVLYAGRLERDKGAFVMLDIAARLPALEFRLAGDGSAREELACEIARRGLANVQLPGFVGQPALAHLMAGALAVVVPSLCRETFGLTVVEAMAAGTPVVASRVGGIPEIVSDGGNGFLCEAGDVEAFVAKLQVLAETPLLVTRIGEAGHDAARGRFGEQAHLIAIERIYEDVLREHAG